MSVGLLLAATAVAAAARPAPAQMTTAVADLEARATLGRMAPDEKIRLLHGPMPSLLPPAGRLPGVTIGAGYIAGIPRLGIPPLVETDASLGVSNLNDLRRGDVATAMPSGMAQAASWDADLVRDAGAAIGAEASAKGFNVMLAGGVNLVRDPRGGRNFEYLGEDPLLAGTLVGAQIAGVQSNGIVSTIKHFAANPIETGRNVHSVDIPERALRESDLLAFEIGIEKGDPGAVMCAYNRVNGIYACENRFLLTDVLRRDWGFKGYVMSDWGAVHSSGAILAGLDQQSGEQIDGHRWFSDLMTKAVADGKVPASAVDRAVLRILRTMYAHGLPEHAPAAHGDTDLAAHAAVAQRVAEEGIVLLRNEGGLLPIAKTAKRIAVIGGHADIGVLSGGGSSQVRPVGGFALEVAQKSGGVAAFAKRSYDPSSPLAALRAARPDATFTFADGTDIAAAAAAARDADLAIVFGEKWGTEAVDQKTLSLDGDGDALVAAIAASNPRTVAVLETGNAVTMPWRGQVPAIVMAWFPGQRGGEAIARVLTGEVDPSGRLPVTVPLSVDQLPNPALPGSDVPAADAQTRAVYGVMAGTRPFTATFPEGADVGYRWFDRRRLSPAYAFGHGLSYTRFRYDGLATSASGPLTVRFRVTNTGGRTGADVPQVYLVRPGRAKRLIGWARRELRPGQSAEVAITADERLLADFDVPASRWRVPAETARIEVARSAVDPVLTGTVRLRASSRRP